MKNNYSIIAVIVLCVVTVFLIANSILDSSQSILQLPENAKLVQEQDGVRFYQASVTEQSAGGYYAGERVYVTDETGDVLNILRIPYDWSASVILVTEKEVIVLEDSGGYPGKAGTLYSINRQDGSLVSIPSNGLYFFTSPDSSYAAFGTSGGTVELTSFGTDVSRTYSLNGDFPIRAMALSPDGERILILSEDIQKKSEEDKKVYASVFLIDIEKDAQSQLATQVATFEETLQEGPFVPFISESVIVWDSNIQATITDDDGQTHIISVPALD